MGTYTAPGTTLIILSIIRRLGRSATLAADGTHSSEPSTSPSAILRQMIRVYDAAHVRLRRIPMNERRQRLGVILELDNGSALEQPRQREHRSQSAHSLPLGNERLHVRRKEMRKVPQRQLVIREEALPAGWVDDYEANPQKRPHRCERV